MQDDVYGVHGACGVRDDGDGHAYDEHDGDDAYA